MFLQNQKDPAGPEEQGSRQNKKTNENNEEDKTMTKKIITLALIVMSVFTLLIPVSMADTAKTMYVNTANGGPLNVRSAPDDTQNNLIGQYRYGDAVTVIGGPDGGWYTVRFKNRTGYVMAKFLTANRISDEAIQKKEIERQLNNYRDVAAFTVYARPTNPATGWVNFRTNPGTGASAMAKLYNGRMLTVIGQTLDWYKAIDSVTGSVGYVMKTFVSRG